MGMGAERGGEWSPTSIVPVVQPPCEIVRLREEEPRTRKRTYFGIENELSIKK